MISTIQYLCEMPHSRVELESTLYKRVILTVIRIGRFGHHSTNVTYTIYIYISIE